MNDPLADAGKMMRELARIEVEVFRLPALNVVVAGKAWRNGDVVDESEAALVLVVTDRPRARVLDSLSPAAASNVVR